MLHKQIFTGTAPGIRATGVAHILPEEADLLAGVDRMRYVGACEANTLTAVFATIYDVFRHGSGA